jgi:hypothetical protein
MLRRQIYLTQNEIDELHSYAKESGISVSEYIRRLLDKQLAQLKKQRETSGKKQD